MSQSPNIPSWMKALNLRLFLQVRNNLHPAFKTAIHAGDESVAFHFAYTDRYNLLTNQFTGT
uniref:Uncharacterized protein n=1 Tax=mine drainage metagenome TaxID=410659 RepID=E6QUI9_9ZZZZ